MSVKESALTEIELISRASKVRENAYAPFSNFLVGAALLTRDGEVFVGCNVENSSYGLTICAERNAIGAMVATGKREIESIAIVANRLASPCGACRQYIVEFGSEIKVISAAADDLDDLKSWLISELLPSHFKL